MKSWFRYEVQSVSVGLLTQYCWVMFWTDPARLARRSCAVTRLRAPIPPSAGVVALIGGATLPMPSKRDGRVVCALPALADAELVRSISKPNLKVCEPLIQLKESLYW